MNNSEAPKRTHFSNQLPTMGNSNLRQQQQPQTIKMLGARLAGVSGPKPTQQQQLTLLRQQRDQASSDDEAGSEHNGPPEAFARPSVPACSTDVFACFYTQGELLKRRPCFFLGGAPKPPARSGTFSGPPVARLPSVNSRPLDVSEIWRCLSSCHAPQ